MKYTVKGFPECSGKIDLPDIAELMTLPMFKHVDANDLYEHGGELYRYLIDQCPLQNDKKYVRIWTGTQLLYPKPHDEDFMWHRDAAAKISDNESRFHILISPCTALTEFNDQEFDLDLSPDMDGQSFNELLNTNIELVPRKIEPCRFITWDTHVHRRTQPEGKELRFMFRVYETDYSTHVALDDARKQSNFRPDDSGGWRTFLDKLV